MYKLAVLDIDGTLINSSGKVPQKNIDTIKKMRKNGFNVAICTGRNITNTLPIVKKVNLLDVPFICMDGAIMYDPVTKKIRKEYKLTMEEAAVIVDVLNENDCYVEFSDGIKYYKYFKTRDYYKYDTFNKHDFLGKIKCYSKGVRYIKSPNHVLSLANFYQMLISGENEVVDVVHKSMLSKNLDEIDFKTDIWDDCLFITRKDIKKTTGVKLLCEHYNIGIDEVVAVGDELNDLDMLKTVGMGVAMGNARKEIKEIANDITLLNNEAGVSFALEKYFFDS